MYYTKEIWKNIPNYEGYQVSNLGRVKSKKKILKNLINGYNYYHIDLSSNHKVKRFSIHRLVAQAFIPNPNNLPQVNHIDGNKTNNCVENLEWCTRLENIHHAIETGLIDYNKKVEHAKKIGRLNRKPVMQYTKDGKYIREYNSIKEASLITNICETSIGNCLSKNYTKSHSAGGYVWKYKNINRKEEK